jgi:hypothetical protein
MRQTAPIGERNSSISTTIVGGGKLSAQKITAGRDRPAGPKDHHGKTSVSAAQVQHRCMEMLPGDRSRFYRTPQGDGWCKPVKLQKALKQIDGLSRDPFFHTKREVF